MVKLIRQLFSWFCSLFKRQPKKRPNYYWLVVKNPFRSFDEMVTTGKVWFHQFVFGMTRVEREFTIECRVKAIRSI